MSYGISPIIKLTVICAAAGGFVAGKYDLDEKIKTAIHNQNVRLAKLSAKTLVDELESRKVALPVKVSDRTPEV